MQKRLQELVSGGPRIGTITERQSTAKLINSKLENKQQQMPNSNCAKYKWAVFLQRGQVSAFVGLSSWLCLKKTQFKRLQQNLF